MRRTTARSLIRLSLLLGVACALLTASAAVAQPRWVRLSFQGDAATSVTVSWNTDSASDSEIVRFGPTTAYGDQVTGTVAPIALPGALGYVHQVQLLGLTPGTDYHYSVGGPGAWSVDAVLRTAPADRCAPLRFVALGDGRSQDDSGVDAKWHDILLDAVGNDPLFILDTGDLVKDGKDDPQWVDWMQETDAFNPYYPHQPSIGNHDDDSVEGDAALYNSLFALPTNTSSNTEDFYYFTAGDAIFVAISSTTYNADAFVEQATWLDAVLSANADKRWKFVWMHHPPYTSHGDFFGVEFNHPPNEVNQNQALIPIFDAHHVDMVFAGHNHYYERFAPMTYNPADPAQGVVASGFDTGTTYVITGGAGAFTYDAFDIGGINIDLIEWICSPFSAGLASGSELCSGKHHYVVIDIDDNVLTFEAVTTRMQNFSEEIPFTIETFQIVKPDLGPCVPPTTDGGTPDAGGSDGGTPVDAGPGPVDAGPGDAGPGDAGPGPDAGPVADAGGPAPDAGITTDSGTVTDAGTSGSDAGGGGGEAKGCGCSASAAAHPSQFAALLALGFLAAFWRRRR